MAATKREESKAQRPNILWIGVDQMRADTLLNSFVQTPNLDRLRARSTCFTRAYSPSSLCTPARGSMYTGRFAFNHGMGTNCDMYHALAQELPQPEQMLHARLQARGYRTGFTGKWHVGTELGPADYGFEGMSIPGYGDLRDDPGFQRYLAANDLRYGPIRNPIYANRDEQTLMAGEWNGPRESTPTHYLANYSLDLLNEFARDRQASATPFFLTCQFWAPHGPYLPAPEFVGIHDRAAIPPWPNWDDDYRGKPRRYPRLVNSFFARLPATWPDWQQLIGLVYDYTTQVDAEIGRLLDRLDELGLTDETIIVFASDHGDMIGSHGLHDKGYMYEEAHRVPLMVALPGQRAARSHDALVYNMDIFPTLLDIAGADDAAGGLPELDGQSMRPFLTDTVADGAAPSAERDALYLEFHGIRYLRTERGLVTRGGLKYIFNPADDDELYDLNTDPAELHNLLVDGASAAGVEQGGIDQAIVDALRAQLVALAQRHGDPVQNCIAKWFGQWRGLGGQPDVSSAYAVATEG